MKRIFFAALFFCNYAVAQTACNNNLLPIVFVHGFMGSGDNFATQIQRFSSNDYCEDRLFVFDWNSIGGRQNTDSLLNNFIDDVLKKTNSLKINLVGHSAGGGLCYSYLKDSLHAMKVSHYVHIGSMKLKTPAGKNAEIPTMNIYSTGDHVMRNGGDVAGAVNVKQTGSDHMQVATCAETFESMVAFFTGRKEKINTAITALKENYRTLAGKAVLLAENSPLAYDSFRVNLFDAKTGERIFNKKNVPDGSYINWTAFEKDGGFGFQVSKESYTEIEVHPKNGRTLFYYFEPLARNNKNVYLRALPTSGMAASMLGKIPNDTVQAALVIFTSNNAVIAGRDSLTIDSIPLSLPMLMPASKTSIATFIYDDGDGITSGKALKSMSGAPFLTGVDVFIAAEQNNSLRIYYNGRSMVLPRKKSSEGIMIAVFN